MPTDTPAPRDNLLGICHAVAHTFGFDPLWLRLGFLLGMLADFRTAIFAYVALGAVLAIGLALTGELRLPRRRPRAPA